MDYTKYDFIKVEKKDGVGIVTLNRPDSLNAISHDMHTELASIFEDLDRDEELRATVLTGAGKAFSAGGDLKEMASAKRDPLLARTEMLQARKIVHDILALQIPIVAAVNGSAIGLGANIALFCDVIIASEKATFADPHVRVGVVAGDGGSIIWPLLVGVARAKELLLTGDVVDATTAERLGLVNKVVPETELMSEAMNLARRLASGPPLAIRWTKMSINKRIKADVDLLFDVSMAWEQHTFYTEDHREAIRAFLEKREPRFTGR